MADIGGIIKKILPAIGAAATGNVPALIAMAASVVGSVLGQKVSASTDAISAAISGATPDQLLALKKADQDFQLQLQQLGFENVEALEKIAAEDRASARSMQVAVKSKLPPALAIVVTLVCLAFEGWIVTHGIPGGVEPVIVGRVLGTLDSALILILSYYFGSSAGSDRKTEILAGANQKKP
jgi:hypothetical protein